MRGLVAFIVTAAIAAPPFSDAQSPNASAKDQSAFNGLILTPAGALPQIVRAQRLVDSSSRGEIALRMGRYSSRVLSLTLNNIALSGMWRLFPRLHVGGTYGYRVCENCERLNMASVDMHASVYRKAAAGQVGGDTDIGVQVSAGVGDARTSALRATSLTFSVPLAVSLPQPENSMLTIFLSPTLGLGRCSASPKTLCGVPDTSQTQTGVLPMVGAGLGYSFAFGLGVHAAVHRIVIEDSPTQFGFALSWRRRYVSDR